MPDKVFRTGQDMGSVQPWTAMGGVKLPNGTYDLEVVRADVREQQGNMKADELMLNYKVLHGEFAGEQTQVDRISGSDDALGKYRQYLDAVWDPAKGAVRGDAFNPDSFVGKQLKAEIYNEEYPEGSGNYNNKFRNYSRYDAAKPSPGASPGAVAPGAPAGEVPGAATKPAAGSLVDL